MRGNDDVFALILETVEIGRRKATPVVAKVRSSECRPLWHCIGCGESVPSATLAEQLGHMSICGVLTANGGISRIQQPG